MLVVVPQVRSYTTLSPIDELQHIDATIKGGELHLVRDGEKVAEPALREQSCRGIDSPGFVSPPCDAPQLLPEQYQEAGYNTAAVHPPTYYVTTGVASRVLMTVVPAVDSPVTAARLLGALWLAAGLMVSFALARALGARPVPAVLSAALLAGTPAVLLSSTTVTPDAAALVSGAVLALATVRVLQGRLRVAWLLPAAAFATVFKATGVLAVGACALAVLLWAAGCRTDEDAGGDVEPRASRWERAGQAVGLQVMGGALPVLLWTFIVSRRALDVPPNPMTRFNVDHLDPGTLVANLLALLPPTQNPYLTPELRTVTLTALVGVVGYLLMGGAAAAALAGAGSRLTDVLGTAFLASMLLGGPVLVILTYVTAGSYFPIPSRYGLPLLPSAIAVLAVLASRRPAVLGLVGAVLAGELLSYALVVT